MKPKIITFLSLRKIYVIPDYRLVSKNDNNNINCISIHTPMDALVISFAALNAQVFVLKARFLLTVNVFIVHQFFFSLFFQINCHFFFFFKWCLSN